ncbi:hypothetical protein DHEL01_v212494 [Diaporthe helianthi]|uniref:Uncharacterized protein n=1 Tax=Diaporthe helianthi TaxID=158607 RepID=A0A2P5HFU2_DIAHE|nr:hypothetical protein DHEL01_v212494 [Diaporthe helianthi]
MYKTRSREHCRRAPQCLHEMEQLHQRLHQRLSEHPRPFGVRSPPATPEVERLGATMSLKSWRSYLSNAGPRPRMARRVAPAAVLLFSSFVARCDAYRSARPSQPSIAELDLNMGPDAGSRRTPPDSVTSAGRGQMIDDRSQRQALARDDSDEQALQPGASNNLSSTCIYQSGHDIFLEPDAEAFAEKAQPALGPG